jgi:ankyrin repeat protein
MDSRSTALKDHRSTALHFAANHGMVEVVRVLLEHGADVGAENEDGETAFQLARGQEGTEIKKLLSEHGTRRQHAVVSGTRDLDPYN